MFIKFTRRKITSPPPQPRPVPPRPALPPLSMFRVVHNSLETNKFPVLYFQNEQITPPIKSNEIF